MTQVRVRDKHQITLPAQIARAANIGINDLLEVSYCDGVITLVTQRCTEDTKPSLMALAGSTKGLYGNTTKARDQYLADERQSWKR